MKSKRKMSSPVFQCQGWSWSDWLICEITRAAREYENNTKGREEEKSCCLKFENERYFLY